MSADTKERERTREVWRRANSKRYHSNPEYRADSNRRRREARIREYGITPERYEEMFAEQGGVCALCRGPEPVAGRSLAVDHDHRCCADSKRSCGLCVRGLLCSRCNTILAVIEKAEATLDIEAFASRIKEYTNR